ncbi:MAG: gamma-glutamylcyclotransferase [Hyphomicrobiaceae bacterium]
MTSGDLWVFGYGSLMWRPGFHHVEAVPAVLVGYRRAFCVYSTHHRGTPSRPGLVLGLDVGGTCHGLAFRVPAVARRDALEYLRARELINGVYREEFVSVELHRADTSHAHRGSVLALAYVVERAHPSYAGHLPPSEQVRIIRAAHGTSGANIDYLVHTAHRARCLGIRAPDLERLIVLAHPYFVRASRCAPRESPEGAGLVACLRCRSTGPRQPRLAERRRFRFRMKRSAQVM